VAKKGKLNIKHYKTIATGMLKLFYHFRYNGNHQTKDDFHMDTPSLPVLPRTFPSEQRVDNADSRSVPPQGDEDLAAMARRLAAQREVLGISRADLARALGVSYQRLANWERALPKKTRAFESHWGRYLGLAPEAVRTLAPIASPTAEQTQALRAAVRSRLDAQVPRQPGAVRPGTAKYIAPRAQRERQAQRARARRVALGLSLADLAQRLGVSEGTLRNQETTLARRVRPKQELAWELALDRAPGWLRSPVGEMEEELRRQVQAPAGETHPEPETPATLSQALCRLACAATRAPNRIRVLDIERLGSEERRDAEIFLQRFAPTNNTLAEIGAAHHLTRERVRQILLRMIGNLFSGPRPADAIEPVVHFIETLNPLRADTPSVLAQRLRDMDPEARVDVAGLTRLEDMLRTGARRYGHPSPVRAEAAQALRQSAQPDRKDALLKACRRVAYIANTSQGAISLEGTAGQVSRRLGQPLDIPEVAAVLESLPGFEWIDEQAGWGWLGPASQNRLVNVASKIAAVAQGSVDVLSVLSALFAQSSAEDMTVHVPPWPVALSVIERIPGFQRVHYRRFKAVDPALFRNREMQAMSAAEQALFDALSAEGGLANRQRLIELLVDSGRILPATLDILLLQSPICQHLDRGVVGLVGWHYGPQALARAFDGGGVGDDGGRPPRQTGG